MAYGVKDHLAMCRKEPTRIADSNSRTLKLSRYSCKISQLRETDKHVNMLGFCLKYEIDHISQL
jgi:hypothetical protein